MDTLALTDRDGTYGAVKFARAAAPGRHPAGARGRPGRGADPAVRRRSRAPARRRTPARGGAARDLSLQQGGSRG